MPTISESLSMIRARNASRTASRLRSENRSLLDRIELLEKKCERMKQALEFYSEEEGFEYWHGPDEITAFTKLGTAHDGGQCARQALKEVEGLSHSNTKN